MLDLSFIGKDGFIIQYEDIISLWGYNVLLSLKEKNLVQRMSDEDILLNYINRTTKNPFDYIHEEYHLEFPTDLMYKSQKALKPNLFFAFKFLDAAYKNGIKNLYIFSNSQSDIIRTYMENELPDIPLMYLHGDIIPVIKTHPNCTFITSDTDNIIKLSNAKNLPPFALMIADSFMYVEKIIDSEFISTLRKRGVFVGFTGILSSGLVP